MKRLGLIEIVTSEWLLTRRGHPNGGPVILLRTLLTSSYVYWLGLAVRNLIDPLRTWEFSLTELRLQILESAEWYGAIFAGIYTALYARFASQWEYLAGVYNQIKAAEAREQHSANALAEWKAGFIEDADELHLATKPLFASVIRAWGNDPAVQEHFRKHAAGGETKLTTLLSRIETVLGNRATRQEWEKVGSEHQTEPG